MAKKVQIKPHFRTHRKNGHPAYVYEETKDEYKYINITHAPRTYGIDNKRLRFNPNNSDPSTSYARPFSTHDLKKNFKTKRLRGYRLHKADKKLIRKIKRKYRQ